MTDRELERQLRAWYTAEVDEDHGTAPRGLWEAVTEIPDSVGTPRRGVGPALLVAAALLVAGGALAGGAGLFRSTAVVTPTSSDAGVETPDPSPVASPSPSPSASEAAVETSDPSPAASPTPMASPSQTAPPAATPIPAPSEDLAAGFRWTGAATSISPTGRAPTAGDTATLLEDGRVLITANCTTEAEIYDPATDTFTLTGQLGVGRASKTATLLVDGRVLITGGYDCGTGGQNDIIESAEIYDPRTGTFTATGSMHQSREFHTATLLEDGRVLVAGGLSGSDRATAGSVVLASVRTAETSSGVLDTAEIYDPATGTFSKTGSMSSFRDHHSATLLEDGRVLVAGGGGEAYASSTSADVYDPATGTFTATGPMLTGRWLHTATLLDDGGVLILGGRSPQDSVYESAEIYDPDAGEFRDAGVMTEGRQQHTATLLSDGRVLIAGGYWSDGSRWRGLASAEAFDPASGEFATIGSIGTPRQEHVAIRLGDGRVLIVGGIHVADPRTVPVPFGVLYEP